jgi:hypothetical protein
MLSLKLNPHTARCSLSLAPHTWMRAWYTPVVCKWNVIVASAGVRPHCDLQHCCTRREFAQTSTGLSVLFDGDEIQQVSDCNTRLQLFDKASRHSMGHARNEHGTHLYQIGNVSWRSYESESMFQDRLTHVCWHTTSAPGSRWAVEGTMLPTRCTDMSI